MRNTFVVLLFSLLLAGSAFGQIFGGMETENRLSFLGQSVDEQLVNLNYEIPYGGVVELHLYDETGNRIWYNTYDNDRGTHTISMKRAAFRSGLVYTFHLKYKISEYTGEIIL